MSTLLLSFGEFFSTYGIIIILVVCLLLLVLYSSFKNKKDAEYRNKLNDTLVKGARVKTFNGVYGTIISITETTEGKIVLLSTGEDDKKSYMQIHINAIAGADTKKNIVLDENGNDITFKDEDEKEKKLKAEQELKLNDKKNNNLIKENEQKQTAKETDAVVDAVIVDKKEPKIKEEKVSSTKKVANKKKPVKKTK